MENTKGRLEDGFKQPSNNEEAREILHKQFSEIRLWLAEKLYDQENDCTYNPIFAEDFILNGENFKGKSLEEAVSYLDSLIETVECSDFFEGAIIAEEKSEVSKLLEGFESLIYSGELTPEYFQLKGAQYQDKIQVLYQRNSTDVLRPGKGKLHQKIETKAISKATFSYQEWLIVEKVISSLLTAYKLKKQPQTIDKSQVKMLTALLPKQELKNLLAPQIEISLIRNTLRKSLRKFKVEVYARQEEEIDLTFLKNGKYQEALKSDEVVILKSFKEAISKVIENLKQFSYLPKDLKVSEGSDDEPKNNCVNVEVLAIACLDIFEELLRLNRNHAHDFLKKVKKLNPEIVLFPSFEFNLKKLITAAHRQVSENKGLTIMMGEAGTGKNEMVYYFSAITGRPLFESVGNRTMEAQEVFSSKTFDAREGILNIPTPILEGLQTPNSIVLIDEANALRPDVQTVLHSIGAGSREVICSDINFKVAKGVVVILLGNPSSYEAAGEFGKAVFSRGLGVSFEVGFPVLKKVDLLAEQENLSEDEIQKLKEDRPELDHYVFDEIKAVYKHLDDFKNLSEADFEALWLNTANEDLHVNLASLSVSTESLRPYLQHDSSRNKTLSTIKDCIHILEILTEWRRRYTAKEGTFSIYGPALRDSIAVFKEYNRVRNVKAAFLNTYNIKKADPYAASKELFVDLEELLVEKTGS